MSIYHYERRVWLALNGKDGIKSSEQILSANKKRLMEYAKYLEASRARFLLTRGMESLGHLNRREVWKLLVEATTKLRATDKPRICGSIPSIFQFRSSRS